MELKLNLQFLESKYVKVWTSVTTIYKRISGKFQHVEVKSANNTKSRKVFVTSPSQPF